MNFIMFPRDFGKLQLNHRRLRLPAILLLVIAGCSGAPLSVPAPGSTAVHTAASPTPTLSCESETAAVEVVASAEHAAVGDSVKVIVTVRNEGCVALGLPQYRLYLGSDQETPILDPAMPEPIVHSLAVGPGQTDSAEFDLKAVAAGRAGVTAAVSYEVHLGYPGPAYWGSRGSGAALVVTVVP